MSLCLSVCLFPLVCPRFFKVMQCLGAYCTFVLVFKYCTTISPPEILNAKDTIIQNMKMKIVSLDPPAPTLLLGVYWLRMR